MPKRGPYAKGVAKREEILDIALRVVARDGYDRTSVREIAREAELSQAGLLHYFSSKEELFVEVIKRREDLDLKDFDGSDPVETLSAVVHHNTQVPGLVRLFATLSAESTDARHPGHAYFQYRYARLRGILVDGIRGQQAQGKAPKSLDPEAVAAVLVAVADGLQVQWLLDPTQDMASRIDQVWAAFVASGEPIAIGD